jgi:signal transduction histidine kinase
MIQELDEVHAGLGNRIQELRSWEKLTEKISAGRKLHYLTLNTSTIKMQGKTSRIIAMNDIKYQMEEQEIESWRKLIRVITHEIMNSITPITTLTLAIKKKFTHKEQPKNIEEIHPLDVNEALKSADIIEERSKGLIHFIEKYKTLTKLPQLNVTGIDIPKLFDKLKYLFEEQLRLKNIQMETNTAGLERTFADQKMIEQVMINLLKNAIEAFDNIPDPRISLTAYRDNDGRELIEVKDNGPGIPEDRIDQVFVPFYTTKETGSGIGLSLCREIIRLHKAEINIESGNGSGTTVILKFYSPGKT